MTDVFNGAKKLGFGMMRLPSLDANDPTKIDFEQLKKMVDTFIGRGFTYFDTAWMYCGFSSESAAKEVLVDRYPREAFTLATKLHSGFIKTEEDRDKVFNEQKRKTGVDFFDYYLIHDINVHSKEIYDRLNVWDWIQGKKASGEAKHIGFSFHDSPELLDEVLTAHPFFEFVQIQLNYLDYNSPAIRSRLCYEVACKHNIPVVIMEPVKGGTLVNVGEEIESLFKAYAPDHSNASWAIRFAASHENVRMVLSGMSTIDQVEDNTSFMEDFQPLNEDEKAIIGKAVDILNASIAIPCTGCAYCVDGCPMSIPIPKFFALYNAEMKQNPDNTMGWTPQKEYYRNVSKNFGIASECIKCQQCEGICPQHLKITEYLETVAKRFE